MAGGELNGIAEGAEIAQLRSVDLPPLRDPNTIKVAFALACGFRFAGGKAFLDCVERLPDGGARRTVSWAMDNGAKADFGGERVGLAEFLRRLDDDDWCRAHPEHPISYLAAGMRQLLTLQAKLRGEHEVPLGSHVLMRFGAREVYLPAEMPEKEKLERLREWGLVD